MYNCRPLGKYCLSEHRVQAYACHLYLQPSFPSLQLFCGVGRACSLLPVLRGAKDHEAVLRLLDEENGLQKAVRITFWHAVLITLATAILPLVCFLLVPFPSPFPTADCTVHACHTCPLMPGIFSSSYRCSLESHLAIALNTSSAMSWAKLIPLALASALEPALSVLRNQQGATRHASGRRKVQEQTE